MHFQHQYIDRDTRQILNETFYGDKAIRFLYSRVRENAPSLFRVFTGSRISQWLAYLNYESFLGEKILGVGQFLRTCGINSAECLEDPQQFDTIKKIFERKIRYWDCRPMPNDPGAVVSPCDAKMLYGSLSETSSFFIKGKFFDYDELIGRDKEKWIELFGDGDFAVLRLTPEKYHYNHAPVAGRVVDYYHIAGAYNSCHPDAVISTCTPYSKNKRVVTVINTDVPGGTQVGLVAMVEVVALMIGDIVQCYSDHHYDNPTAVGSGLFMRKGQPKSLFRPGSSTVILFFEKDRIRFADDIAANMSAYGVQSLFNQGFGRHLVETDIKVRSRIGTVLGISN
ncbi:MAG: phosphatidylserine decarboxylase [Syntrophaceae bacterium]|nr:phosphatidylserine decarboxylase [Syntrophaceae bacterium]